MSTTSRGLWASLMSPFTSTGTVLYAGELHAQRLVQSAKEALAEDKIKSVARVAKIQAEASNITAEDYKKASDFLDSLV